MITVLSRRRSAFLDYTTNSSKAVKAAWRKVAWTQAAEMRSPHNAKRRPPAEKATRDPVHRALCRGDDRHRTDSWRFWQTAAPNNENPAMNGVPTRAHECAGHAFGRSCRTKTA